MKRKLRFGVITKSVKLILIILVLGTAGLAHAQQGQRTINMGYIIDFPASDSSQVFINEWL